MSVAREFQTVGAVQRKARYGRMASPLSCSVFQCCSKYDCEYEDFMSLSHQHIQGYYRSVVSDEERCKGAYVVGTVIYKVWSVSVE